MPTKKEVECAICGKVCKSIRGLAIHLKVHSITTEEYYIKYLKVQEDCGICPECGKKTSFYNLNVGYLKFCSPKCASSSSQFLSKRKRTCLERYGVENSCQAKEVIEKQKQTNIKKFGVENVFQSKEIQEKIRQTNLKRYGVEKPQQNKDIQEKTKNTCLRKYGVEHVSQLPENISKIRQSFFDNYGVNSNTQKNITNFDLYYNVEFIKDNFINEYGYVKVEDMVDFFNISKGHCHKHLTSLNIKYSSRSGTSHCEEEISKFIKSIGVTNIVRNTKQIICPNELDLFLPEHSLAIEFDGIFWHSEQQGKKKNYHLNKTKACVAKGIKLIHIWENEWVNKESIIKSILMSKFGRLKRLCGARQTNIKEISISDARKFLNTNHRQGYIGCNKKLGAYYNNKLVAVMTFSKPSISKGRKDQNSNSYELSRFATILYHNIPGIASKLLSFFKNNYKFDNIYTFADKRFSLQTFYTTLGFTCCGDVPPCYWYFDIKDSTILFHRFNFRKSELPRLLDIFDPDLTEYQNMLNNGYDRIWDCGNYKFIYTCK